MGCGCKCEVQNKWGWLVTFNTFLIIMPVTGVLSAWGVFFVELQKEFPDLSDLEAGKFACKLCLEKNCPFDTFT